MKLNKVLCSIAFVLIASVLISCVDDDLQRQQDKETPLTLADGEFVQGVVVVKFEPEVGEAIEANLAATDINCAVGTRAFAGFPQLERLSENIKITKIKRTFPHAGKFEPRTRARGMHLWYDIYFEPETGLTRAVQDFGQIDGIQIIEPVPVIKLPIGSITPLSEQQIGQIVTSGNGAQGVSTRAAGKYPFNDPFLSYQWHYFNDGSKPGSVAGADINVFDVWQKQTGHPDVIVAVVDVSIDYNHPDLAANVWINEAEQNGLAGTDDDNNGYIDDIYGWDFVDDNNAIEPGFHGTHVAGTIAAVNNNGIGVCGIAGGDGSPESGVRVMSCQIFKQLSDVVWDYIGAESVGAAAAIKYGADNGAVISQNSWGYVDFSQYVADAVDYFIEFAGFDENGIQTGPMAGGIVICGSGNNNTNELFYPAAFESAIAVSAIDYNYTRASYSNYGDWVDIAAPGGDIGMILSTTIDHGNGYEDKNGYTVAVGTSMACPHVSGVAALMVSEFGVGRKGYTAGALKERLLRSVKDLDRYNPYYEGKLGSGLVDASKAILQDRGASPTQTKKFENLFFLKGERETLSLDLGEYFSDPDTQDLGYEVSVTPAATVSAVIKGAILSITPREPGEAEVTVIVYDELNIISSRFKVSVREKDMALFPNPVSDKLFISLGSDVDGNANVKLYNATGVPAYNGNVMITPFAPGVVDVSGLARGTYTVVVTYEGTEHKDTIVKI